MRACLCFPPMEDNHEPHNDSAFLLARALDENITLYSNYTYRSLYTSRQDDGLLRLFAWFSRQVILGTMIPQSIWREREREIIFERTSLSFIQRKSPEIVCNMECTFSWVHLTPELALKASKFVSSRSFLRWIDNKPIGGQVFMLEGWEVRSYARFSSLPFDGLTQLSWTQPIRAITQATRTRGGHSMSN